MQKKEKRATSKQNALHIKLPFLSLCFLVYFPFRGVLLERLFDRGDRSSLLQREDVFFGRFPVVILLRHCVSLFFKPPLRSSKAQQKQNEKKKDRRHFSCRQSRFWQSVCVFVCLRARVILGTR